MKTKPMATDALSVRVPVVFRNAMTIALAYRPGRHSRNNGRMATNMARSSNLIAPSALPCSGRPDTLVIAGPDRAVRILRRQQDGMYREL